jgi:hypothetical protein
MAISAAQTARTGSDHRGGNPGSGANTPAWSRRNVRNPGTSTLINVIMKLCGMESSVIARIAIDDFPPNTSQANPTLIRVLISTLITVSPRM